MRRLPRPRESRHRSPLRVADGLSSGPVSACRHGVALALMSLTSAPVTALLHVLARASRPRSRGRGSDAAGGAGRVRRPGRHGAGAHLGGYRRALLRVWYCRYRVWGASSDRSPSPLALPPSARVPVHGDPRHPSVGQGWFWWIGFVPDHGAPPLAGPRPVLVALLVGGQALA